jgi:hypothetical protein
MKERREERLTNLVVLGEDPGPRAKGFFFLGGPGGDVGFPASL